MTAAERKASEGYATRCITMHAGATTPRTASYAQCTGHERTRSGSAPSRRALFFFKISRERRSARSDAHLGMKSPEAWKRRKRLERLVLIVKPSSAPNALRGMEWLRRRGGVPTGRAGQPGFGRRVRP